MGNISNFIHQYNILCANYLMENGDNIQYEYKKFFNIKTLNTICKNLYMWKHYDLVEQCFKLDGRTYLYLLKRLICLGNTNQFLHWFNKYNVNWKKEKAGLKYLLIQILKYDNINLFKYFIDNFNVDKFEHDFYVKTILHISYNCWGSNILFVMQNILTINDIPKPFNKINTQNLYILAKCEMMNDNPQFRAINLASIIKEKHEMNILSNSIKKFLKNN